MSEVKLYFGDCLEILPTIPGPVDAIITDLPYGTTACSWDVVIPFAPMWEQIKRLLKPNGAFITTASQPFTSMLICSNLKWFRYEWIWKKNTGTGAGTADKQPLRYHENVCVFYHKSPAYNPQPTRRFSAQSERAKRRPIHSGANGSNHVKMGNIWAKYDPLNKLPESVIEIESVPNAGGDKLHPTQKPLALYEYLILTYTNPGDTVLDFCMGSGTTGEAAIRTGRNFIGCEIKPEYYAIAERRIHDAQLQIPMPLVCQ